MDTTGTYIKMCEKAEEIQGQSPEFNFYRGLWLKEYAKPELVYNYQGECWWVYKDGEIWLPTQSQLQEMVKELTTSETLDKFYNWFHETKQYAWDTQTFGQLWLAFVMKENHGKVWTGKDWVKEK